MISSSLDSTSDTEICLKERVPLGVACEEPCPFIESHISYLSMFEIRTLVTYLALQLFPMILASFPTLSINDALAFATSWTRD